MRLRRFLSSCLAGLGLAAAAVIATALPAAADCEGPTLVYEAGEVSPGDTVRVQGRSFGNNCWDTGPPPVGEGFLGLPVPDIDIVVVQDGAEWVVASGNSDGSYAFEVAIVVPDGLAVGDATISARWGADDAWQPYVQTTEPLIVTAAEPVGGDQAPIVFGPPEPAIPDDVQTEPPTDDEAVEPVEQPADGETRPTVPETDERAIEPTTDEPGDERGTTGVMAIVFGVLAVAALIGYAVVQRQP